MTKVGVKGLKGIRRYTALRHWTTLHQTVLVGYN